MVKVHMTKEGESMAELAALAAPYGRTPTFGKKLPFVGALNAKIFSIDYLCSAFSGLQ